MSLSTEKATEQETIITSGFQEDLEHLRQTPLLRGLDYKCLKLLAMLCRRTTLIVDDQLMVQGEDDGHAFMILSGKVNALYTEGDKSQVICQFGAGQFIGGTALFGKSQRLFTVQAAEETTILRLRREEFRKVIEQFPGALSKITSNLVSELVAWDRTMLEKHIAAKDKYSDFLGVSLL